MSSGDLPPQPSQAPTQPDAPATAAAAAPAPAPAPAAAPAPEQPVAPVDEKTAPPPLPADPHPVPKSPVARQSQAPPAPVEHKPDPMIERCRALITEERQALAALTAAPQPALTAASAALAALTARAVAWRAAASALAGHVAARRRAAEAYARAVSTMPPPATLEAKGAPAAIVRQLEMLGAAARVEAESAGRELSALKVEAAEGVAEEAKIACKRIAARAEGLDEAVESCTRNARASLTALEAACTSYLATPNGGPSPKNKDPWMLLLKHRANIAALRAAHRAFCAGAEEAAGDLCIAETRMSRSFGDAVLNVGATKLIPDLQLAAKGSSASVGEEWKAFRTNLKLQPAQPAEQITTLRALLNGKAPHVVMCGEAEREAILSWKKVTVVATVFGYLHYFGPGAAEKSDPDESVPLSGKLKLDVNGREFRVEWDSGSFFNSNKNFTLRTQTEQDTMQWVDALKHLNQHAQ